MLSAWVSSAGGYAEEKRVALGGKFGKGGNGRQQDHLALVGETGEGQGNPRRGRAQDGGDLF
uniref:Uncharacterized protein n=1 Tax=Candidatus Kentrum sp. LPFa TaxID=2126335 RepID=A0A450WDT1_9GAMM|nr:MAG: hypothetical protein BECKLPF1236A_GA0070988_101215 [Candidatus Kentron sp. LPFa]VFK30940.1 MAG: hypothetical protein BECKLPF1236C_GA0070990_101245 [Candidatus Kentron sp. LPFa]